MNVNLCLFTPLPAGYGSQVWIYADPTGLPPLNGTYVVGPIPVSSVTAPNCPYMATLPIGTSVVRFIDENSEVDCYTDIPVVPIKLCEDCTFTFDSIDNNQIGQISVGNLISSGPECTPLTSYLINWYDSNGVYQFSSGDGINYSGLPVRNYTHPLTGSNAIPSSSGQYYPQLVAVSIDGVDYSSTGAGGALYVDFSECGILDEGVSVVVQSYTCEPSNTSDDPNYDHKVFFNAIGGSGNLPINTSVSIVPSSSTEYLALKFKAGYYADRLRVELFKQSDPSNPIRLESITAGIDNVFGNSNSGLNSPTQPNKRVRTSDYFYKLIPLNGLSINTFTDFIKITVFPSSISPSNPATNWTLYFTCLDTFDCDLCSSETSGYKLCASGLTINYFNDPCLYDITKFRFKVLNPCYPETNLDPKIYLGARYPEYSAYTYSTGMSGTLDIGGGGKYSCAWCLHGYNLNNFLAFPTGTLSRICQPGNGFIIYTKGFNTTTQEGILTLEFGSFTGPNNDRQKYINYWNQAVAYYYSGTTKCGVGPFGIPSNTQAKYYQFIRMAIPQNFGSPVDGGADTPCGDNIVFKTDILLHPSSIIDTTIPNSITWRIPIIANNYVPLASNCGACQPSSLTSLLTLANNYTQLAEGPIQNNFGAIYTGGTSLSPFYQNHGPFFSAILFDDGGPTLPELGYNTLDVTWDAPRYDTTILKYSQTLHPFSGTSLPIPSLSGEVCDYNTKMTLLQTMNPPYPVGTVGEPIDTPNSWVYHRLNYWYKWFLVDPNTDDKWIRIVTRDFDSLGSLVGPEIVIFERDTNGIIVPPTDPTYWDCIGSPIVYVGKNELYSYMIDSSGIAQSPYNYYFGQCPNGYQYLYAPPIEFALTNGYSNLEVLTWEIIAEDLGLPGTGPNGYYVRWNVSNIPSYFTSFGFVPPNTFSPFPPGTIIGPTDASCLYYGTPPTHGWCGPCYATGPHTIRITVTANLTPSVGGGSISGFYDVII